MCVQNQILFSPPQLSRYNGFIGTRIDSRTGRTDQAVAWKTIPGRLELRQCCGRALREANATARPERSVSGSTVGHVNA